MDDGTLVPVVTGLAIGIGFVIVFALMIPDLENDDADGCCDDLGVVTFGDAGDQDGNAAPEEQARENSQSDNREVVEVAIDFSPILAESDIIVKKGQAVKIPIAIESGKETEKVLTLSIMPYSDVPAKSLTLSLDKETMVLSEDDVVQGKARDNGSGWLIRDAGFLTVSTSFSTNAGTYEYGLEASFQGDGDGMGAGQAFRVIVIE